MSETDAHIEHPTPRTYWAIFIVLFVVTALEVAIAYTDMPRGLLFIGLGVFALAKFAIVVGWYMHLRFDKPLYRRFFVVGLIGAPLLFLVMLATFGAVL